MNHIRTWGQRPFELVIIGCSQFVLLTLLAMAVYPGGTKFNPQASGYTFFQNFFSELGFTITRGGYPNPIAAPLFFMALTLAGSSLVLFFVVVPQFFWQSPGLRIMSILGSLAGVVSGLSYVGIAFTPGDLLPKPHLQFVLLAFRAFLPAVLVYLVAILSNRAYPNRYAVVYAIFAILLAAYIALITRGPDIDTARGVLIQATGQKIIVYAAIVTILVQSWGARQLIRKAR